MDSHKQQLVHKEFRETSFMLITKLSVGSIYYIYFRTPTKCTNYWNFPIYGTFVGFSDSGVDARFSNVKQDAGAVIIDISGYFDNSNNVVEYKISEYDFYVNLQKTKAGLLEKYVNGVNVKMELLQKHIEKMPCAFFPEIHPDL